MPIHPTAEQFRTLVESDDDGRVVMLNLLKFAARDGRTSYASYGDGVRSVLEATGARLLWQGRADSVVIGDERDDWDAVILVEYPSRKAFCEMVKRPDYTEVSSRRTAALVDSRLIACTQVFPIGTTD
jgi:uncharacterized protein (DUF1330 family)